MRSIPALLRAAALFVAASALAGDGVVEINQDCADSVNGCFCGDAQFLPVTITGCAGRSYRLTSDLYLGSPVQTALEVSAPDISIDLGGFAIRGLNVCSGQPLTCAYSGTGRGIEAMSGSEGAPDRLRVTNGSIIGTGGIGVLVPLGSVLVVRDVRIAHNGSWGIVHHGESATIDRVTSTRNGGGGAVTGSGGTVQQSHFDENAYLGLQVGNGSHVASSTFRSNTGGGLMAGAGTTVDGCEAVQNGSLGVYFHAGTAIGDLGGVIRDSVVSKNQGDGITTRTGVLVSNNSVVQNTGAGLSLFESAYGDNLIVGNPGGAVVGSSFINLGGNGCINQGATPATCP